MPDKIMVRNSPAPGRFASSIVCKTIAFNGVGLPHCATATVALVGSQTKQVAEESGLGLELKNLTKRFGKISALRNVTLASRDHEFISLVGPSGCGKSTALRLLAGLTTPSQGELFIDQVRVNHDCG